MAILKKKIGGKNYFYEVKSYRESGKIKQKILRYFGRIDPRKNPEAKPIIKQSVNATYRFGDVALLYHCADKINLINTINKYMPKRQGLSHGLMIFLLAAHRLTGDKPSGNNLQQWYKTTFLPHLLNFNPEIINKNSIAYSLDCINNEERNIDHTLKIAGDIHKNSCNVLGEEGKSYFYDLTSTYFEGACCPIAKYGYNRDGIIDKLQINIGMIADKKFGFPLMTKVFEGNINDTSTMYEVLYYSKFILKKDKIFIIMDRGMGSEDNIKLLDTIKYDYIIGVSEKHSFVEELKLKNHPNEKEWAKLKSNGKVILIKKVIKNLFGKKRFILIYYNEDAAKTKKELRDDYLSKVEKGLASIRDLTFQKAIDLTKGAKKYFVIKEEKGKVIWRKDKREINKAEIKDGKFCIMTNKDLSPEDIFKIYHSKDGIEKAFRHIKQDINLHPTRKRLADRVRSDIFICHIAYVLLVLAQGLVRREKLDVFWDTISSESKEIRLLEYCSCSGKSKYDYVANNKIQKEIVDKLKLGRYLPQ